MRNWGGLLGRQRPLMAETLGLTMARRAAEILDRHRAALSASRSGDAVPGLVASESGDASFAADDAVFTAILDAANECLGRFDHRPADERWCDALLQLLDLATAASAAP